MLTSYCENHRSDKLRLDWEAQLFGTLSFEQRSKHQRLIGAAAFAPGCACAVSNHASRQVDIERYLFRRVAPNNKEREARANRTHGPKTSFDS